MRSASSWRTPATAGAAGTTWKRRRLTELGYGIPGWLRLVPVGFKDARHVPATLLNQRYFAGRSDGLRTSSGEELLVATT